MQVNKSDVRISTLKGAKLTQVRALDSSYN